MISRWIPNAVYSQPDRGPREPPPLAFRVEWRPESTHPWWACWADGSLASMHMTLAQAQAALNVNGKELAHG